MTRFAIDAEVLLEIAAGEVEVHADHQLVGPGSLRSQAQAVLYASARDGRLDRPVALERLERITEIKMRLLNDRDAEYLAVAQLQADALVTADTRLARLAAGIVPLAAVRELSRP